MQTLVVTYWLQDTEARAIAQPEHAQLRACEPFFDDDGDAGGAEASLVEACGEGAVCLRHGVAHDDPLAQSEAVGLDHAQAV